MDDLAVKLTTTGLRARMSKNISILTRDRPTNLTTRKKQALVCHSCQHTGISHPLYPETNQQKKGPAHTDLALPTHC